MFPRHIYSCRRSPLYCVFRVGALLQNQSEHHVVNYRGQNYPRTILCLHNLPVQLNVNEAIYVEWVSHRV